MKLLALTVSLACLTFSTGCDKDRFFPASDQQRHKYIDIGEDDSWELPPEEQPTAPIPEPGAGLLFGAGMLVVAIRLRSRK